VVGFITKGRGITLHREECPQLNSPLLDDARKVPITWTSNSTTTYAANIRVWTLDRVGVLRDITTITTTTGLSVVGMQMHFAKNKTVQIDITVKVANLTELNRIIRLIRGVEDVLEAKRVFI
jgi:GTP pyrophosphokinase